ncbi:putative CHASE domain, pyridoxal phosphate-dependent transferase, major domain-containing protein [Helianthus annuus]|nr:putative CHASE domain, pyridoxal phosphate-dependent transferase, major domain-containing protein [Helianthus annuus]
MLGGISNLWAGFQILGIVRSIIFIYMPLSLSLLFSSFSPFILNLWLFPLSPVLNTDLKKSPYDSQLMNTDLKKSPLICRFVLARGTFGTVTSSQIYFRPVIPLGHGDPSAFPCFRTTKVTEDDVVESLRSANFNGYCPTVGILPARRVVAEYLSQDLLYDLSPDDVFLTLGCTQAKQRNVPERSVGFYVSTKTTFLAKQLGKYKDTFAEYTARTAFERPLLSGVAYAPKILNSEREDFESQHGGTTRTMANKEPSPHRDE